MRRVLSPLANLTSPHMLKNESMGVGSSQQPGDSLLGPPGPPPPSVPSAAVLLGETGGRQPSHSSEDSYLTTVIVIAAVSLTVAGILVVIWVRAWRLQRVVLPTIRTAHDAQASSGDIGERAGAECSTPDSASPRKQAVVVLQPDRVLEVGFQEEQPPARPVGDTASSTTEMEGPGGMSDTNINVGSGGSDNAARSVQTGTGEVAIQVAVVDLAWAPSLPHPEY